MRGKKKLLAALPTLTARELVLIARDLNRAADAAAIGGASSSQWCEYVDAETDVKAELERRFPGTSVGDPYDREGEEELRAVYRRIVRRKGGNK